MTIKQVLCYLFWLVPAIVGTYLWSSWFLLWFFIPLAIMAVLAVSLFSEDDLSRDKWSYKLLYKRPKIYRAYLDINLCDLPSDVIWALVFYLVIYPIKKIGGFLLVVFVVVIEGFFILIFFPFGVRPTIFEDDPETSLVSYKKWPTIKGFKLLPVYLLVPVFFGYALNELYSCFTERFPSAIHVVEGKNLGFVGIVAGGVLLLLFCTALYMRSESWHKTRKTIGRIYRSKKDRFCLTQKVVN